MNSKNYKARSEYDRIQKARRKMDEYLELAAKSPDEDVRRKATRNAKRWAKECGETISTK